MFRDLPVPAIILGPKSPGLETIFWRDKLAPWRAISRFLVKIDANHGQIKANIVWIIIYACPRSFWAQNRRGWRHFSDGSKLAPWRANSSFMVKIDANHGQIKTNIVWIVIYACPRSFWAPNRLDWRQFLDGPKLAPWRASLGFWQKSMPVMPKSRLILY